MKNLFKNFGIFFVIFILIIALFNFMGESKEEPERVSTGTLISRINNEELEKIIVEGTKIEMRLKDGNVEIVKKETGESLSELLNNFGVEKEKIARLNIEVREGEGFDYWLATLLPFLLPFLLIGLFLFFMIRGVQGAK